MSEGWGNVAQIASAIVALSAFAVSLWAARDKRNSTTFAEAFARLNRHENRISSIESDLRHLPNKDSVHELKLAIAALDKQMAVVVERVGPIKAIAERMQEVLLENGGK